MSRTFLFLKRCPCSAFRSFHHEISCLNARHSQWFPSDSCGLHTGPNAGPCAQRIGHTSEASFERSEARPQLLGHPGQCQVRQVFSCTLRDVEDSILLAFVSQASIEGPIFTHGNLLVDDLYTLNLFPSEDVFPCNCCKNFHANMHGYCNSHRLSRFHRQFFSRCHLVPRLPQLVIGISVPYTLAGINWVWVLVCVVGDVVDLCVIFLHVWSCPSWSVSSFSLVNSFDIFECPESRALLEAFQWSELLLIFLVQAAADIESRALLALIIVSLCLDCIRIVFKTTPAPPDRPIL